MKASPPDNATLGAWFSQAAQAQQQGQGAVAETLYRRILAAVPGHLDTAHNLAVLLGDQQRHGEAL